MKLKEHRREGVVVLVAKGRILGGSDTQLLESTIKELIDTGVRRVVLDLADVTLVNSSGLGSIISSHSSLRKAGGDLKLLNVSNKIESLLIITKLVTVFDSYRSEDEAVAAFGDRSG
ncbi:MAG: anti-anti-sigma factor [Gemmatimonadetes bacterium]|nr:anti-anti-sigma factor [Gemmatimonadota bacterium]